MIMIINDQNNCLGWFGSASLYVEVVAYIEEGYTFFVQKKTKVLRYILTSLW